MSHGAAVSVTGQTGQSDDTHSPDEWASTVANQISSSLLVDRGGLHRRDLVFAQCLAHDLESVESEA